MLTYSMLLSYWSADQLTTNGVIILNLLGSLALGLLVGYERSYHGRAAGMRTYGLVCMASCALTVVGGYSHYWFGGGVIQAQLDPTRVIQGIVSGIGFLGAGVIMREGFNISGLTTAASLWASSVIGVTVGLGFYLSSMALALMCAGAMMYLTKLEKWLPSRHAVAITMRFRTGFLPDEKALRAMALARGYEIALGSLMVSCEAHKQEWRFVAIALNKHSGAPLTALAAELNAFEGVDGFQLTHARN